MKDLGWWSISGEGLLDLLRRAYAGEDPDMLYAEEYANAERDHCHNPECPDAGRCFGECRKNF